MVEMARVLVAEDDEDILVLLETVLDDAGFAVVVATDVAAALRILRAGGIDCVLTDLGLPGQSGIVLAKAASAVGAATLSPGSTDVEALARELTSLADEMHSRARGAA
jgi:DNA-binding response OmpR family regulator